MRAPEPSGGRAERGDVAGVSEAMACLAAGLQAVAYVVYLRRASDGRIEPNPTSWLMWAYGTALVVVLESDQGIHPALRLLPIVCAACCVCVAGLCWRRGSLQWPEERPDRIALGIDLSATGVYVAVTLAAAAGSMAWAVADAGKAVLLVCLSLSTVVSFLPMLRGTRQDPSVEEPAPWMMWTVAYTLLLAATIREEGASLHALQFWVYPAVCAGLSGMVAWYAAPFGLVLKLRDDSARPEQRLQPDPSTLRVVDIEEYEGWRSRSWWWRARRAPERA